jgi:hypothetical protein
MTTVHSGGIESNADKTQSLPLWRANNFGDRLNKLKGVPIRVCNCELFVMLICRALDHTFQIFGVQSPRPRSRWPMSGGDREQIASGWQFAGRTAMLTGAASGEEGDGPEHRGAKETPGMRRMVE